MPQEKPEVVNQEVRSLLALGMIQPSLSLWASETVCDGRKQNVKLCFCCVFRSHQLIIKNTYHLPRN